MNGLDLQDQLLLNDEIREPDAEALRGRLIVG
jgi:hypothetical protein